ncbi:hypothetical protein HF086_015518 [Spodoptera exigua]|uniref:Uncharacterized protein n=1 Tax=Spodoptera exigua TaxID=7107 RepID=A0A922MXP8_SPOEX|nr:hypothetical protein HF086_015518 [Spodoptera exigua]
MQQSIDTNTDHTRQSKSTQHTQEDARRGEARRGAGHVMLSGPLSQSGTTSRRRELARTAGTPGIAHPSWSRRSRSTPATGRTRRQSDDIPVFDRNKVSLDLPGSLFGPSVSLLIRTTKIIGDVIQVSDRRPPPPSAAYCSALTVCSLTELRGTLPDIPTTFPATLPRALRDQGPGSADHHHYYHQHGSSGARGQRSAEALRAALRRRHCLSTSTHSAYRAGARPRQ